MAATTILLTIGIALLAILDVSYALPSVGRQKEVRGKHGFRTKPGKRLTVARGGCLACIISLGIALVIAHEELARKEADRVGRKTSSSFILGLLLTFSVVINTVMLYVSLKHQWSAAFKPQGCLLPLSETPHRGMTRQAAVADDKKPAGGTTTALIDQGQLLVPTTTAVPLMSGTTSKSIICSLRLQNEAIGSKKTTDAYTQALCIKVDAASGHKGELHADTRVLDRRDSDVMLGNLSPPKRLKTLRTTPLSPLAESAEPVEITNLRVTMPPEAVAREDDERLMDALMHNTVKVLVES